MKLYIIDISSFIFRAFYAIRALTNSKKQPTNAIYGVATMLARFIDEAKPEYVIVTYDSKEPSFRSALYEEYKANRSAPPEDLIPQFDQIEKLVALMGFPSVRKSGVEADDLIATWTKQWRAATQEQKGEVVIVTGDKDLMQLVDDHVSVWDTMYGKVYHPPQVEEKFGVPPHLIRDFLALVGDSSDNVPGVPGIGPKTALDLIKQFGNLEGVIAGAQAGKVLGKKGQVLAEHVGDARLSYELVTLKEDVELGESKPGPWVWERARFKFEVTPDCLAFLKENDFHSLATKWTALNGGVTSAQEKRVPAQEKRNEEKSNEEKSNEVQRVEEQSAEFVTVLGRGPFDQLLKTLSSASEFVFDTETTSLNPRVAELVGMSFCVDSNRGYYVPISHRAMGDEANTSQQLSKDEVLTGLKPLFENPRIKKIAQNIKYDMSVLKYQGVSVDGLGADTMLASYLLEPEGRHNLDTLALKYLGYTMLTYAEVCGKGKDQILFDQVSIERATRYSAEDAWATYKIWKLLKEKLHSEKLMEVLARVDLPLVPVLAEMECAGVHIDEPYLRELSREFAIDIQAIEKKIEKFCDGPVNLNSPKQMSKLLFEDLKLPVQSKTKTGYSTDASVLEILAPLHEVPRLLLEYREISKLKGTYVDPLPTMKDPVDHKIHTSFHQTVAATGRLSSSDPNLQNIPIRSERGRRIRKAFIPSPGNRLISADYSQIELRILAHMSEDPELVDAFNKGEDVHKRTAAEIYGVKADLVNDEQRSVAKAINFGLMYGKTPFGLAQELGISRKEAALMIERYFERYSAVKRFLDGQIEHARETGWVVTLLGRKRALPDIRSKNPTMRGFAERMAMNTPIQGTAADLMKLAMIQLSEALKSKQLRSQMIIQVHDEIVVDALSAEADEVKELVTTVMENALVLKVPLVVSAAIGDNWMEL